MSAFFVYAVFGFILGASVWSQIRRGRRRDAQGRAAAAKAGLSSEGPRAQHPHIDISHCIGCGACAEVCPEGDVLAILGGKAAIVNGHKCIGHGLCSEACPVGAIEIVMAPPSMSADLPRLTPELETSIPGIFVVGELGGLALIKNAVNQGRDCVDILVERTARSGPRLAGTVYDVCVVGAGPAGISASLRCIERGLSYVTLEQGELGGTVAQYPRQKLVMTSPVELPLYGKFKKLEISKERLLEVWQELVRDSGLKVRTRERVDQIQRDPDGAFTVISSGGRYRARQVILALGRRGTPRKLGVPGEDLPKVMYSLIDAEAYTGKRILVVGGGDSAVEAAMGLAYQKGNRVTLSYRQAGFNRIKQRNANRIEECARKGQLEVVFESHPVRIGLEAVALAVAGEERELPNDFVWVFAGGTPPNAMLERFGIAMGPQDLTVATAQVLHVA